MCGTLMIEKIAVFFVVTQCYFFFSKTVAISTIEKGPRQTNSLSSGVEVSI